MLDVLRRVALGMERDTRISEVPASPLPPLVISCFLETAYLLAVQ